MKSKLFRYTSLFIGILLIAGLFFGAMTTKVAANTPAQTADDGNMSAKDVPGWKAATRPWTKAEMLAAKPYPMPNPGKEFAATTSPEAPTGAPGLRSGNLPMTEAAQTSVEPEMGVFSSPSPMGYAYPAPFTRFSVFTNYVRYPYVTVGKLFFTQYGLNYVCSASSIGNYAIWTAGHCVHKGDNSSGGWSYNIVFVPAYKNGSAPKGQWTASYPTTRSEWYASGDLRYDIGGAVMYTNSGFKLSQVVGALGFAWNWNVNQHWFQLGYPHAAPFDGTLMFANASSYAYSDTNFGAPQPVGVGNDLSGGSSGGPWIFRFKGSGAGNYVNGVNSYRYTIPNHPLEMFSPYYGDVALSHYQFVIGLAP